MNGEPRDINIGYLNTRLLRERRERDEAAEEARIEKMRADARAERDLEILAHVLDRILS